MHPLRSRTTYTEALGDEVCVYEWVRHEVHALNPTAACVWQLCDGKTSVGEIAQRLRERQLPYAEQLVELALEAFKSMHLIDADRTAPAASPLMSRRALVKRGLTAALLPVVASVVAPTPLQAQSPGARLQTFDFTGTSQMFIVPPGLTSVTVSAFGAQGRGYFEGQPDDSPGGLGGSITATLAVTPGETLVVVVGGNPLPLPFGGIFTDDGGFNGGGRGGDALFSKFAGPGGGASDVRRGGSALVNRVVVAGGGGGAGTGPAAAGGAGGGTVGGDGGGSPSGVAGTGGTQTAGGIGGVGSATPISGSPGQAGVSGIGGNGGSIAILGGGGSLGSGGGGGGGGYYGGGGGAAAFVLGFGAGGGSSFAHPSATGVVHVQGTRAGAGLIVLSW